MPLDHTKIEGYDPTKDSGNRIQGLDKGLGAEKAYGNMKLESQQEGNQKKAYAVVFTREDDQCPGCNDLKPSLQGPGGIPAKFDSEHVKVYKVDPTTEGGANLAKQLGVKGWPTTVVVQNGKEVGRVAGNNPRAIENMIASNLPPAKEPEKPAAASTDKEKPKAQGQSVSVDIESALEQGARDRDLGSEKYNLSQQ